MSHCAFGKLSYVDSVQNSVLHRKVEPELLDSLPPDDLRAVRSRSELRWINALMGNERWILQQLKKHRPYLTGTIVEWGAGEGKLCQKIRRHFPQHEVTGVDFLSNPFTPQHQISWRQGNLLQMDPHKDDSILVANLFLHHLTEEELLSLKPWLIQAKWLIMSEPLRKKRSHFWGKLLHPVLHDVTRHDMHISIDAGFVPGELSKLWAELHDSWLVEEWEQWPGAYRSVWRRK